MNKLTYQQFVEQVGILEILDSETLSLGQGCVFDLNAKLESHTADDAWVIELSNLLHQSETVKASRLSVVELSIIQLNQTESQDKSFAVLALKDLDVCIFAPVENDHIDVESAVEYPREQALRRFELHLEG